MSEQPDRPAREKNRPVSPKSFPWTERFREAGKKLTPVVLWFVSGSTGFWITGRTSPTGFAICRYCLGSCPSIWRKRAMNRKPIECERAVLSIGR
jgi:hypothetical protein